MGNVSYDEDYCKRVCEYYEKKLNKKFTCWKFEISRPTLDRWLDRFDGTLESLRKRSTRPHSNPNQCTLEEVVLIKEIWKEWGKYGGNYVYAKLFREFEFKRRIETMYRVLHREGLIKKKKQPKAKPNKPYDTAKYPGEKLQMDVKYVPKECYPKHLRDRGDKYYQFTIIDEATGMRYLEWFDDKSTFSAVKFLFNAIKFYPFQLHKIQTDNGREFTNKFSNTDKLSAFEKSLKSLNIKQQLIKPATPKHNGKVERSHKDDNKYFYEELRFETLEELNEKGEKWLEKYNNMYRRKFNYLSPNEVWKSYKLRPKKPIKLQNLSVEKLKAVS